MLEFFRIRLMIHRMVIRARMTTRAMAYDSRNDMGFTSRLFFRNTGETDHAGAKVGTQHRIDFFDKDLPCR